MIYLLRLLRFGLSALFSLFMLGVVAVAGVYFYIAPDFPSTEVLRDVRFQVPLRIYSADGKLIGEYGEQRRAPLAYDEVPRWMIDAILSAEDERFFSHPGVDYRGLLRAAINLAQTGERAQGGSTITMQLARNFFLSSERTYIRKIREIFLALKIERELSKEEILNLYLNKIYLGQRAYGVEAAAQVYYGKSLSELNLAQTAMIAGLPKAPSLYNPVVNPDRALLRRAYVLRRMHELGKITDAEYQTATAEPVTARRHAPAVELEAPFVAEMIRAEMVERYGAEAAYTSGFRVYATVDSATQQAANRALREGLLDYDRRHGYRGPVARVALSLDQGIEEWQRLLAGHPRVRGLETGLVVALEAQAAHVYIGDGRLVRVDWNGLQWARPYIDDFRAGDPPKTASEVVTPGDIVRLEWRDEKWLLAREPQVSGALVAIGPYDGRLLGMIGGFDFGSSHFNRATQAERQPGSSFKPFVFSAALERGMTAATVINDAPVVFDDDLLESTWRPENYSGRFFGPTRLREGLVESRNLVSIRVMREIGIGYTVRYLSRFGFEPERLPRDLSLSLGSGAVTPLAMVRGYAVFANGGYLIEPYVIDRIEDGDGEVVYVADPLVVCPDCELELARREAAAAERAEQPLLAVSDSETGHGAVDAEPEAFLPLPRLAPRTIEEENAYIMTSMMEDVIRHGTGRQALRLGRRDLAGKTGTTNEQRDAWFVGYGGDVVAASWIGFDTPRPLGTAETGGRAALPIWTAFMGEALAGRPERQPEQPAGLVTVRIDPETGRAAAPDNAEGIFEIFRADHAPEPPPTTRTFRGNATSSNVNDEEELTEQLF